VLALLAAGVATAAMSNPKESPMSLPALGLVVILYVVATARREQVHDYFFNGIVLVPAMLIGWSIGRGWAGIGSVSRNWERYARIGIVGALSAVVLITGFWNVKASFLVSRGQFWFGKRMTWTEEIAETIVEDADGKSITAVQMMPGNSQADLIYFLRIHGARLQSKEMYRPDFPVNEVGDYFYLVVRREAMNWSLDPAAEDLNVKNLGRYHDARIYRIERPELAKDVERVGFERDGTRIQLVTYSRQ
jgi:hypothetical protein